MITTSKNSKRVLSSKKIEKGTILHAATRTETMFKDAQYVFYIILRWITITNLSLWTGCGISITFWINTFILGADAEREIYILKFVAIFVCGYKNSLGVVLYSSTRRVGVKINDVCCIRQSEILFSSSDQNENILCACKNWKFSLRFFCNRYRFWKFYSPSLTQCALFKDKKSPEFLRNAIMHARGQVGPLHVSQSPLLRHWQYSHPHPAMPS